MISKGITLLEDTDIFNYVVKVWWQKIAAETMGYLQKTTFDMLTVIYARCLLPLVN